MERPPDKVSFVSLLKIIIAEAGGVEDLAKATNVRAETLRRWRRGEYPRERLTPLVENIDFWASKNVDPYPPSGYPSNGLSGFVDSSRPTEADDSSHNASALKIEGEISADALNTGSDIDEVEATSTEASFTKRTGPQRMAVPISVALSLSILTVIGIYLAVPAEPEPSRMTETWVPWGTPTDEDPEARAEPALKGDIVAMICWNVGYGELGSGKWFNIVDHTHPRAQGYVPANIVQPQVNVGHC